MKKLSFIGVIVFVSVFALLAYSADAQTLTFGCCCNVNTGESFATAPIPAGACIAEGFQIVAIDPSSPTDCRPTCAGGPPITPPQPPAAGACDTEDYESAPSGLVAKPIKGKKWIELTWDVDPCDPDYYVIQRCAGDGCSSFSKLDEIPPHTRYVDKSTDILWKTDYSYRLIAHYNVMDMNSDAAEDTVNTGDIECWYHEGSNEFCLSEYYYTRFKDYFQTNGYAVSETLTLTAADFNSKFEQSIRALFLARYNDAYTCDEWNVLSQAILRCDDTTQVCVSDYDVAETKDVASCIAPTDCDKIQTGLFGLEMTRDLCEGTTQKNFCFYDRSYSLVDYCFKCPVTLEISCYDYKTQGACESDNCGAGACVWKPVFEEIGVGVCIDENMNNCGFCEAGPNPAIENPGSGNVDRSPFNYIYEQCSVPKAAALSTPSNPCYFSEGQAIGCEDVSCNFYTEKATCNPNTERVILDADNRVVTPSQNNCNIPVCQWIGVPGGTGECVKNADGDTTEVRDCIPGDVSCELDYFPPESSIISTGKLGRVDQLNIHIYDKVGFVDPGRDRVGENGYKLYFCMYADPQTSCDPHPPLGIPTTNRFLTLNDGVLRDGETEITTLDEGKNAIRYYAQDRYKNMALIQGVEFDVCHNCQGPRVVSARVLGAHEYQGGFYTSNTIPEIEVMYDEPASVVVKKLSKQGTDFVLNQYPQAGLNYNYSFTPGFGLNDGRYTFTVNSQDVNGLAQDAPFYLNVTIDTTPAVATVTVNDQPAIPATILEAAQASVSIVFDEIVNITRITVDRVIPTSYGYYLEERDVHASFSSSDQMTFTGSVGDLSEGKRTLRIYGFDLAGNSIQQEAQFYVNAQGPFIAIAAPSYGVAPTFTFDLIFETLNPATCRYWFKNMVNKPSVFTALSAFDSSGNFNHTKLSFSGIQSTEEGMKIPVYVECVDAANRPGSRYFNLTVDTTPPSIRDAYASPAVIAQEPFKTSFRVSTDDETFCKFDKTAMTYDLMNNTFPGFEAIGKKTHSVEVNVSSETPQTYSITCINLAELGPATASITFSIDLSLTLNITDQSLPGTNSTNMNVAVATNKDALCSYGLEEDYTTIPFDGERIPATEHSVLISDLSEGSYTYYVTCTAAGVLGEIESATVPITFIVDFTPPWMVYADDSSILDDPEYSWLADKVRVKWLGEDNESGVNQYLFRIEDQETGDPEVDWTITTRGRDGEYFYIDQNVANQPIMFTDGASYIVRVMPINTVGSAGDEMETDGFTVDTSLIPPVCLNMEKDDEETDVDCGGICGPTCPVGGACVENNDCASYFCENNACQPTTCDDDEINGDETDEDCGGDVCPPCNIGAACEVGDDCKTGTCIHGVCSAYKQCTDGVISGDETDVDCGGSCPDKCATGQSCLMHADCISGTKCKGSICISCGDDDFDCDQIDNCRDDDIDNDGDKNWEDPDDDNDGICDTLNSPLNEGACSGEDSDDNGNMIEDPADKDCDNDLDNDGIPNEEDDDMDGDGLRNIEDDDNDNDGITDTNDPDDDNDGILDIDEDSDRDGLPDSWELRYGLDPNNPRDAAEDLDRDGLTNLEEYRYGTNPTKKDTDGDGWNDQIEIEKKTDPLDPDSHPRSRLWTFLLVIIILGLLGVIGYFGYQYYLTKQEEAAPEKAVPHVKPKISLADLHRRELEQRKREQERAEKLSRVKTIAKPLLGAFKRPEEWLSINELERQAKQKFPDEYKDAFTRLRQIRAGKLPREEEKALKKEIFERLREISSVPKKELFEKLRGDRTFTSHEIEGVMKRIEAITKPEAADVFTRLRTLSSKEKSAILAKLKTLEKLGTEQREALFKKLKVTAQYYHAHKDEIEDELRQR